MPKKRPENMTKRSEKMPKRMKYQRKAQSQRKIAMDHIKSLFEKAKTAGLSGNQAQNQAMANRYVSLARKTAMKFKIRLPSEYKRSFCKHCYASLVPGKNLRVRTRQGKLVYYCLECKKFWRKPVGRKNNKTK